MSEILKTAYVKLDEKIREIYRSQFTQMLGELAVFDELTNRGYAVDLISGQGSHDLEMNEDTKKIKRDRASVW